MAIQDDNTILMKSDLKAYHEAIAPMLGGSFMMNTNVSDYYSENEKIVGVWIDGKPIYQKTINCGTLPNNTKKAVAHGISNIEKVVSIDGSAYGTTGGIFYAFTFPNVGTNNQYTYDIAIDITGANIDITTQTDRTFLTGIVTIKYTKTNDTASTAITTPGCYDINFPNTWPENKEIFFGNGLYGQRFTGTIATTTAVQDFTLATLPLTTTLVNIGGTLKRHVMGVSYYDFAIPYNYENIMSANVAIDAGVLKFVVKNSGAGNIPYDIWVTYTK